MKDDAMNAFQIFVTLSVISFVNIDHAIDEFLGQASPEEAAEAASADPDLFSERQKAIALEMQVGPDDLPADISKLLDQSDAAILREYAEEAGERIREAQIREENTYYFQKYHANEGYGTGLWDNGSSIYPVFYTKEDEDGNLFQVRRDDVDMANERYTHPQG